MTVAAGRAAGSLPCPCGRPMRYADCCQRWHGLDAAATDARPAPTPEDLMRSRYSAFVLDLRAYLLQTWHPDHRPSVIEPPEPGLRWLGLDVRQAAAHPLTPGQAVPTWAQALTGGPLQAWGEVTFVARCKLGGRAQRIAEHSVFALQGGWWRYAGVSSD